MTEIRRTCADCEQLKTADLAMTGMVWYCSRTGYVVPQRTARVAGGYETRYLRVPGNCPLPDEATHKSDTPLDRDQQEIRFLSHDDISALKHSHATL